MANIINLTKRGAEKGDGRSCFVELPPHIQTAVMTVVNIANQDDADSWKMGQGRIQNLGSATTALHKAAAAAEIPLQTVDKAVEWAVANPSLALRSMKKIDRGSAPTVA